MGQGLQRARMAARETRKPTQGFSALDQLDMEIFEASDDVKRGKQRPVDVAYAHGLGRARFLLTEHINALSKLVASQAALIEVRKALDASKEKAVESAVGSLMLAQLALRAGDKDGLIHVNDALKALTA